MSNFIKFECKLNSQTKRERNRFKWWTRTKDKFKNNIRIRLNLINWDDMI